MVDPRFYITSEPLSLTAAAKLCGGEILEGSADLEVKHVASIESDISTIKPGGVLFLDDPKKLPLLEGANSLVFIVQEKLADQISLSNCAVLVAPSPRVAFAKIATALHQSYEEMGDDSSLADPVIAESAKVHPSAIISRGVIIKENVSIQASAFIGPGCEIGESCVIGARSSISHTVMGEGCVISAGAVLGQSGFGYVLDKSGDKTRQVRMPQFGRVLLADEVDIGANSCVDRGGLADTIIGSSTKLDNLVHIGHNVILGEACVIAGQVGISGSTTFGDRVMIGGQAGTADHLKIGDDCILLARAGLMRDMPDGERWGGFPAQPGRLWLREVAAIAKLAQRKKK